MQSYLFSLDLSLKISNSTPKGAPECAMESTSYDWDVRNSQNQSKKPWRTNLDLFHFLKYSLQFERALWSLNMGNLIKLVWLGFERVMEKDLIRLLYRTCGFGLKIQFVAKSLKKGGPYAKFLEMSREVEKTKGKLEPRQVLQVHEVLQSFLAEAGTRTCDRCVPLDRVVEDTS